VPAKFTLQASGAFVSANALIGPTLAVLLEGPHTPIWNYSQCQYFTRMDNDRGLVSLPTLGLAWLQGAFSS